MIYDLDTIDTMRYDRWKKTVYISIYDAATDGMEHPHDHYFRHKLEYCVSYILRGGAAAHFSLNPRKKYRYSILFYTDFIPGDDYAQAISAADKEVREASNGMITVGFRVPRLITGHNKFTEMN